MNKFRSNKLKICALLTAALVWLAAACHTGPRPTAEAPPATRTGRVHELVAQDLRRLARQVREELLPLARRGAPLDSLQRSLLSCRRQYKRVEAFTEYFMPATSRLLNGPPLDEIEVEENKSFEPGGLQVLEEMLFPQAADTTAAGRAALVREVRKLVRELKRAEEIWAATELTDAHVFDALRLQVFRLVALGITGFDAPLSRQARPETAASLDALLPVLACYAPAAASANSAAAPTYARLQQLVRHATTELRQHPQDFDGFDRLHFITAYANPLGRELLALQRELGVPPFRELRALRPDVATLFDSAAFDSDFYAANTTWYRTPAKVALGRRLFHEPRLSSAGTRSCASCHQPERAFTDGLVRNLTLTRSGPLRRNTPTILNAALQAGQFYDLRSSSLENQTLDVVQNQDEMHGSLDRAAAELGRDSAYRRLFAQAFPQAAGRIEPQHLQNALASYERSLVRLNSRVDRHLRGEGEVLSRQEQLGFNVFMGKGRCGTCHFAPLFNGTVPPAFQHTESEVLGVPATAAARRLDPDPGRYAHTRLPQLRHSFKTPTVRNVARTAPYMHNGVYRTLREVIDFYDQGGGQGLGLPVDNQTLPADQLHLTAPEKKALEAFLLALTDDQAL
ncbi:cytochrome-c peroxidase [Hymenobacter weizhouensis]|uniref:cytochrome-c peroxidase n=1 Tax=Hymenobacter sp. YIM 151500-1 TaxID=2987689 RepID=UPI0022265E2D|nr:cytochrome c peroxidase [Hymenobacter sp. YIM 151500-1]UYZ63898.1 cytochrome C peroxidase [Hymenobacter sp. YIM 151500-1]